MRRLLPLLVCLQAACLEFEVQSLPNHAPEPVVEVDPAGPVRGGTTVTLNAGGSRDGDPQDQAKLRFEWRQVSGDAVALDSLTAPVVHFTAPRTPQTMLFLVTVSDGIDQVQSAQLKVEVVNSSPEVTVEVSPESPVIGGTLVIMDASGSHDPDPGDDAKLTFRWEQAAGQPVPLDSYEGAIVQFTAPRSNQTLIFFVTVSDGVAEVSRQVTVDIGSLTRPVARAGPDLLVSFNQRVLLDAAASEDKDGDPLTFEWEQLPGDPRVALTAANTVRAEFIAPAAAARLGFQVVVSDGRNEDSDQVYVEVKAIPEARITFAVEGQTPELATGQTRTVGDGDVVVLSSIGSIAPNNGSVTGWRWTLPQQLFNDDNPGLEAQLDQQSITFVTPTVATALVVKLAVSAPNPTNPAETVWSADVAVTIIVSPRPLADPGAPYSVLNRTTVRLDGSGSVNAETYEWRVVSVDNSAGECCLANEATDPGCPFPNLGQRQCLQFGDTKFPAFTPFARGTYEIELVVGRRSGVRSHPESTTVTATNNKPRLDAGEDRSVQNGRPAGFLLTYTDPDDDLIDYAHPGTAFKWSVSSSASLPYEMKQDISLADRFAFTPRSKGTYTVQFVANDGWCIFDPSGPCESDPDEVIVTSVNGPPLAAPVAYVWGLNKTAIQLDKGDSKDPDNDQPLSYLWSKVSEPPGAVGAFDDPSLASPRFTPSGKGFYKLALRIGDGFLTSDAATVTVESLNNAPVADPGDALTDWRQSALTLSGGRSYDPDDEDSIASYAWAQVGGTSIFSGADTRDVEVSFPSEGPYAFKLVVKDNTGATSAPAILDVNVTRLNHAPEANAGPDLWVAPGAPIALSGSGADPDGDGIASYEWILASDHTGLVPARMVDATPAPFPAPPSFDARNPEQNTIVYRLYVTDAGGATSLPDRLEIHLSPGDADFVFVSVAGSDTADCGVTARPCKSLNQAILQALQRPEGKRNLLVTAGIYDQEPVLTTIIPWGVNLLGGWDPVTFERDLSMAARRANPERFLSELRAPAASHLGTPVYPIPERVDGWDNDCDQVVDEEPLPPATGEICNYLDDEPQNGRVDDIELCGSDRSDALTDRFEPNDSADAATYLKFGHMYGRDNYPGTPRYMGPKDWGGDDWYWFTLPVDIPAYAGDGKPARLQLWVDWEVMDGNLSSSVRAKTLRLYRKGSAVPILSSNPQSGGSCCSSPVLTNQGQPLAKGDYLLQLDVDGNSAAIFNTSYPETYRIRVRAVAADDPLSVVTNPQTPDRFEGPGYCQDPVILNIPGRSNSPAEVEIPVIEGMVVKAPPLGINNAVINATDNETAALSCSGCALRLRDSELFGDGRNLSSADGYAVRLVGTRVLATIGEPVDYGVLIERNLIQAAIAKNNYGLWIENAPDFMVRDNMFVADYFLPQGYAVWLLDIEGSYQINGSNPGKAGHVRGNVFDLRSTVQLDGNCVALYLDDYKQIAIYNNVFNIQSDCGLIGGGAYYNNNSLWDHIGADASRLVLANNVFLARPDIDNRSRAFYQEDYCRSPWLIRNNYFQDFDTAIADCKRDTSGSALYAQPALIQWNAFSHTGPHNDNRPFYVYGRTNDPSITEPLLADASSSPVGKLGPRGESKRNFVGACAFEGAGGGQALPSGPAFAGSGHLLTLQGFDWTGATGSPCLDKGSITAPVLVGQDAASESLRLDMKRQPRPVNLDGVTDGPDIADGSTEVDGTDIGPVERQP